MEIEKAVFVALFTAGIAAFTNVPCQGKDLQKDLSALNLTQADVAGSKLTSANKKDFLKAEELIRSRRKLDRALGILEKININSENGFDNGYAAVNLSMSRAYFLQDRYLLSLKHAHKAVQFCSNRSSLWSKALFITGAAYAKLDENDKAVLMFRMAAENREKDSGVAGLALMYLKNLKE